MREAREKLARQARHVGQRLDAGLELGARHLLQAPHRIGDGIGRRVARVERVAGVLEHHLDAGTMRIGREIAGLEVGQFGPAQANAARGRIEQAIDQPHQGRLAASRFAHQPDRLASADGETDLVDGMELRQRGHRLAKGRGARQQALLAADGEPLGQLGDIEQRPGERDRCVAAHNGFQQATTWRSPTIWCGSGWAHRAMRRSQRSL